MKKRMLGMAGVVALLFSVGFASANIINLVDVTKSEVIRGLDFENKIGGSAYSYYSSEDGFIVKATINNLPDPKGDDFYEGWAVRKEPFAFISTGKLTKDAHGNYVNMFQSSEDYRGYDFYVLTLEPNDGNPAPADHIVEGDMKLLSSEEYEVHKEKSEKMMKKPDMMKSKIKAVKKPDMMKGKYYSRINSLFAKYNDEQLNALNAKIENIKDFYKQKDDISETKKTKIFEILSTVEFVINERLSTMNNK